MSRALSTCRWLLLRGIDLSPRRRLRAAIACVMLLSFLVANFGYPVWEPVISKGSIPFPCQFSRCGCQTLEQCRQHCCCHSKQEKVAWALERGLDPDTVAILTPDEKREFTRSALANRHQAVNSSCCSAKPSCCSPKPSCCSQGKGGCETEALGEPEDQPRLHWVLAIAAQKCRGTAVDWMQAGFVAEPPHVVTLTIHVPEIEFDFNTVPAQSAPAAEPLFRPA